MPADDGVHAAVRGAIARLVAAVSSPLAVADADGRLLAHNRSFAASSGAGAASLTDRWVGELLEPLPTVGAAGWDFPVPQRWQLRETAERLGASGTTTLVAGPAGPLLVLQLDPPRVPVAAGPWPEALGSADRAMRVQQVAVALSEALTVSDVTDVMLGQVAEAVGASGFLVTLLDEDGVLAPIRMRGYGPEMRELIAQRAGDLDGAPMQAVLDRRPLVFGSPEDYLARFPTRAELVERSGMQSWVYLPLLASGRVIGAWSVGYAHTQATSPVDVALLTTLAVLCAQTLERARLYEREHEVALVLQRAIAPAELPVLPGARFAARYVPATLGSEVGGDFFDVIPLEGNRAMVVLGDVVGHDIESAALMGQVRATLRAYAATGDGPVEVLRRTNRLLRAGETVTCCCYEIDLGSGRVALARAGHPPPLLLTADGRAELLEVPGGLPLGARLDERYPVTTVPLRAGDTLLLYTDGLVESRALPLDVGLARLVAAAAAAGSDDPDHLVAEVLAALAPDRHADDIALLAMQRGPTVPHQPLQGPDRS